MARSFSQGIERAFRACRSAMSAFTTAAICSGAGYALVQTDTDKFSAGCAKNLTREQALARWNRTDKRAVLFTAAINAHVLELVA